MEDTNVSVCCDENWYKTKALKLEEQQDEVQNHAANNTNASFKLGWKIKSS